MELVIANYEYTRSWCRDYFCNDYFEFCFSYTSLKDRFREIDRYLWESRHEKTRFLNRYCGAVVIDISEWSEAMPNDYFDAFMFFLKDLSTSCQIAMISDKACEEQIVTRLRRFFQIEISDLLEKKDLQKTRRIGFAVREEEMERV